jgi:hypothetical protein
MTGMSHSQARRAQFIKQRAAELAATDKFRAIKNPGVRGRAARSQAEQEWLATRQYEYTEIVRTDGAGHADPDGTYATTRAIGGGAAWATTYTPTELHELAAEITEYLTGIGYVPPPEPHYHASAPECPCWCTEPGHQAPPLMRPHQDAPAELTWDQAGRRWGTEVFTGITAEQWTGRLIGPVQQGRWQVFEYDQGTQVSHHWEAAVEGTKGGDHHLTRGDMQQGDRVWVTRLSDDGPVPTVGLVVAWHGEDYVWVVWGAETAAHYLGHVGAGTRPPEAVHEAMDELTPRRRGR